MQILIFCFNEIKIDLSHRLNYTTFLLHSHTWHLSINITMQFVRKSMNILLRTFLLLHKISQSKQCSTNKKLVGCLIHQTGHTLSKLWSCCHWSNISTNENTKSSKRAASEETSSMKKWNILKLHLMKNMILISNQFLSPVMYPINHIWYSLLYKAPLASLYSLQRLACQWPSQSPWMRIQPQWTSPERWSHHHQLLKSMKSLWSLLV